MRILIAIVAVIAVILGLSSVYTVNQAEQAIVLQFGEVKRLVREPGLHTKLPFVQNVVYFDKRLLNFESGVSEVPTKDQKQVVVDAFARYRIVDPLEFYKNARTEIGMASNLNTIIGSNLRAVFGEAELSELLTPERARLIRTIAQRTREQTKSFGIDVVDVRIKRLDLPTENSEAIFRRMETQRRQEAVRIRAEGERDAQRMRADADKRVRVILAEAERKSQTLRGEGEGVAQQIYNEAFSKDREFFDFWYTMTAYRDSLLGANTRYVGPLDGDFFRYFGDIEGKRNTPTQRANQR